VKVAGQKLGVGRVPSGSFGATRKGGPFTASTSQPRTTGGATKRQKWSPKSKVHTSSKSTATPKLR